MLLDHRGQPMPTTAERERAKTLGMIRAKLRAAYDAAQTTSENRKHWRWADDLSASEANSLEVRRTLRARSRYECLQSNSFAKGIVCTLANDFVSTGPNLQLQLKDKERARVIEQAWRRWMKASSLVRKLRTARLAKCVDGETFLLAKTNPRMVGPVKLDLRLVEADQMSTPGWFDGLYENAVDGIKFDDFGNPIEYHELPYHPGDRRGFIKSLYEYSRINPRYVIHLYNHERPGQARGVPEVTPALPLFAMLRRYTLAAVLAAETAADFVAILQTQAGAFDTDGSHPQNPFESVDIDRGMMTALPYGYELSQLKAEQPTTTYVEFRNALLQEIARCIHMPTNKARGDSSGYNYSSGRLDHQIYYHAIECERIDWQDDCLDRILGWWMEEARLVQPELFAGLPQYDDIREVVAELPHRWTWRPATSINPREDATAATTLIESGLMSERQYLLEHGMDPESHWADIEEETPRRAARMRALAMATTPPVDQVAEPTDPEPAEPEPAEPVTA
jgi:lambda family phage portal protein